MSDITGDGITDANISQEELEQMFEDEAAQEVVPPCVITLKNDSEFHVTDVGAWQWHPRGVFATGKFDFSNDAEEDILFFTENIAYMKLDFQALQDYQDAQRAEVTEGA